MLDYARKLVLSMRSQTLYQPLLEEVNGLATPD